MPFGKAFVSWTWVGPADIAVGTGRGRSGPLEFFRRARSTRERSASATQCPLDEPQHSALVLAFPELVKVLVARASNTKSCAPSRARLPASGRSPRSGSMTPKVIVTDSGSKNAAGTTSISPSAGSPRRSSAGPYGALPTSSAPFSAPLKRPFPRSDTSAPWPPTRRRALTTIRSGRRPLSGRLRTETSAPAIRVSASLRASCRAPPCRPPPPRTSSA